MMAVFLPDHHHQFQVRQEMSQLHQHLHHLVKQQSQLLS
jgi:hypothetical protein